MSSTAEIHLGDDDFNVLVTGFAPFYENSPVNSSWEIARKLPSYLPITRTASDGDSTDFIPPIRIFVHPEPIKVAYKAVREIVPTLLAARRIDLTIHIGMAVNRNFYSIERRAHRDGYLMLDVDCMACPDLRERTEKGEDWIWYGLPEEILTDVNVDDTLSRWRAMTPGADVRISEDPGRFLCDFIYYSSLAELSKRGQSKKAVFLHVPKEADAAIIEVGLNVTIQLIKALAQSELRSGKTSSCVTPLVV